MMHRAGLSFVISAWPAVLLLANGSQVHRMDDSDVGLVRNATWNPKGIGNWQEQNNTFRPLHFSTLREHVHAVMSLSLNLTPER